VALISTGSEPGPSKSSAAALPATIRKKSKKTSLRIADAEGNGAGDRLQS
jgi:hypothetical protein